MRDTKPKIAKCNRCGSVVLAAMSCGFRAAVEPTPLKFEDISTVIMEGGQMYRMYIQAGTPTRLEPVHAAMLKNPAAQYGTYLRNHGCGCHAMDATAFEEPTPDPPQAPASALDARLTASAAERVTQPHTEPERLPAVRCGLCKRIIEAGDADRFQISWPVWDSYVQHVPNRGGRRGYTKTHEGWAVRTWAIHGAGCQPAPTTGPTSPTPNT